MSGVSPTFKRKEVRLTVDRALAFYNLRATQQGNKAISINELARRCGVAATTIHRLTRAIDDPKRATSLSLDLASKIVTVLDAGIDELMEVVEYDEMIDYN